MSKHSNHPGTQGKENSSGPEKEIPESQAELSPNHDGKGSDIGGEKPESGASDQAPKDNEQSPEERIAELEALLAEANDQYLRKAADFENFRKRMNKEKQDSIEYANQSLLLDLVQTMDDFERALKSAESMTGGEFSAFYEGFSMIEKRLASQLENKWGLKRFNSQGEPFDPSRHEALQMEMSPEITEPVVQDEYYKGYTLKNRVIRSAKVKVLMPGKNEEAPEGDNET